MALINKKIIFLIFFIFFLGCSQDMQESTHLNFSIENKESLKDLNVNLFTYRKDFNSKWYCLVKKETIVNQGDLIKKTSINSNVFYYEFYVFNTNFNKMYYTENIIKDNVVENDYSFAEDHLKFKVYRNKELFSDGILYYKKFENSGVKKFIYYDPNKAKFELTQLEPDTIATLESMTFEELLETDKLLNKDILKLKNISMSQKKKLIEAHNMKKFEN